MAVWREEAKVSENKRRIERAAALACKVCGDLNIALSTGRLSGGVRQSCVARLDEAMQSLKGLEPKEKKHGD
jgi:hypothetical protein